MKALMSFTHLCRSNTPPCKQQPSPSVKMHPSSINPCHVNVCASVDAQTCGARPCAVLSNRQQPKRGKRIREDENYTLRLARARIQLLPYLGDAR